MDDALQGFTRSIATVRAGRANPNVLDNVYVDYYGAATPLNQLANVTAPEARSILITPYDKSAITEIERAIQKADLGLMPSSDGNLVRINIPMLTEDRRKELVKVVSKFAEESRVQIRNIRREANDQFRKQEKDGELTEDGLRSAEENVQKKTDEYINKIEEHVKAKETEILEV